MEPVTSIPWTMYGVNGIVLLAWGLSYVYAWKRKQLDATARKEELDRAEKAANDRHTFEQANLNRIYDLTQTAIARQTGIMETIADTQKDLTVLMTRVEQKLDDIQRIRIREGGRG